MLDLTVIRGLLPVLFRLGCALLGFTLVMGMINHASASFTPSEREVSVLNGEPTAGNEDEAAPGVATLVERSVSAGIVNSRRVGFKRSELVFISSPDFTLKSLVLEVSVSGKRSSKQARQESFLLSFNGAQMGPSSLSPFFRLVPESASSAVYRFELQKMKVQGTEPFLKKFLKALHSTREGINFFVGGKRLRILNARLLVSGTSCSGCATENVNLSQELGHLHAQSELSVKPVLLASSSFSSELSSLLKGSPMLMAAKPVFSGPKGKPSPTPTVTATPSPSETPSPVFTPPGKALPSPSPVASPSPSPDPVVSATPSPSPSPSPLIPAPQTRITLVSPSGSLTNSNSLTLEFESDQVGVNYECILDNAASVNCESPLVLSNLQDGNHQISVHATNAFGSRDAQGASYAWAVDTVPSVVQLEGAEALPAVSNSSSFSIAFKSADSVAFQCTLDAGERGYCASPVHYVGLSEGAHSLAIRGIDAAGNISPVPATFNWSVDVTAPVVRFLEITPDSVSTNSISKQLAFLASESSRFECSLDQRGFSACSSPVSLSLLPIGTHLYEVRAIDSAGNVGSAVSHGWNIDVDPPVISVGQVSPAPGSSSARQILVDFSVSEAASVTCSLNGAPAESCASPFIREVTQEGFVRLVISAQDAAGNFAQPAALEWNMDFTTPTISWKSLSPSSDIIPSTALRAEIGASEAVNLRARLNGVSIPVQESTVSLSALAEGEYQLSVSSDDFSGNSGNTIEHSFKVDLTAPRVLIDARWMDEVTNESHNQLTFSLSEEGSFQCSLDGSAFESCSSPLSVAGLSDGVHQVVVRGIDLAGNQSSPAQVSWSVDLTAPATQLIVLRPSNQQMEFQLSSNEAGSNFVCSLDGASFSSCSSSVSYSSISLGEHSFVAKAIDRAGNMDPSGDAHSWTVYPAVTTSIAGPVPSGSEIPNTSMSVTLGSNIPDATFLCSLNDSLPTPCPSSHSLSQLANGNYTLRAWARDPSGQADGNGASYSWSVNFTPPSIVSRTHTIGSGSATIVWNTNIEATSGLKWGTGSIQSRVVADDGVYKTSHSVRLSGLLPYTVYSYVIQGHDRFGNLYNSAVITFRTLP